MGWLPGLGMGLGCQEGWVMVTQAPVTGWLRLGCLRDWESQGSVMMSLGWNYLGLGRAMGRPLGCMGTTPLSTGASDTRPRHFLPRSIIDHAAA